MNTHMFGILGALAAVAALNGPAAAEGGRNCAPHATVTQRLGESYGETRQSIGLDARGALVEVYASVETGTWSIAVTAPNGLTCLIASGQSFEPVREAVAARKEDA